MESHDMQLFESHGIQLDVVFINVKPKLQRVHYIYG